MAHKLDRRYRLVKHVSNVLVSYAEGKLIKHHIRSPMYISTLYHDEKEIGLTMTIYMMNWTENKQQQVSRE